MENTECLENKVELRKLRISELVDVMVFVVFITKVYLFIAALSANEYSAL